MTGVVDTSQAAAELEKWNFLINAPARDASHPELVACAKALKRVARTDIAFFHLAQCLARDCIVYQTDTERTGGEDIAGYTRDPRKSDPIEALRRGKDDCDAKARLFVALCLACGYQARMRPHWEGCLLRHVSAEVLYQGKWRHVETIIGRARFGERAEDVPRETKGPEKGKWKRS